LILAGLIATAIGAGASATAAPAQQPSSVTGPPQHPIAGTKHQLHSSVYAAKLYSIVTRIRSAIRICDQENFYDGLSQLENLIQDMVSSTEGPFSIFFGDGRASHDIGVADALFRELGRFPNPCPPTTAVTGTGVTQTAAAPSVEVSASGGAGNVNAPPTNYFGLRNPFTLGEVRGVIKPNANNFVETAGGGFRIDFTNVFRLPGMPGGPSVEFAYNHTRGNRTDFFSAIDPMGNTFLIEGTGDPNAPFSAGLALGAGVPPGTAGGANVVTGIVYDRIYRSDAINFMIEQPFLQFGNFSFSALAGVNVSRTTVHENLSFSIPLFLTSGTNSSHFDFLTYAPAFGGGIYMSAGPATVYGKAVAGPALTSADLTDRLNLRGFINTNQMVIASDNHTGFYGAVTGGVRFEMGDFFGDGSVTHVTSDSLGNVVRTGQVGDRSRINFERSEATTVKFKFGIMPSGRFRLLTRDASR